MTTKLADVAKLFLRLGFTAFGGPAAHIALMQDEVVERRRWMTHERFLDMLGAANLIPGPSSSELAIFIGYEQAGVAGLLVAGACFVLPAALMTGTIAWAYVRYGSLPQVGGVLYGIKPVIIAIVLQALWGLFPKAIKKSWRLGLLGATACAAAVAKIDAIAILLGAGCICAAAHALTHRRTQQAVFLVSSVAAGAAPKTSVGLGALFLTFLKAGSLVFGSGYVLLAFLHTDLVDRTHWMTESQLVDAIAVGQITPGPVFTSATFIGYVLGGGWGALVATIAIFLPGFVLVAAIRPIVARVRKSPTAGAFLDGVNVASLALMAVVSAELGRSALLDWIAVALAVVSLFVLVRWKPNPSWLIAGGAAIGGALTAFA